MQTDGKPWLEPYRSLFAVGALAAAVGVTLWLLFLFGWLGSYPREAHANLMFFGFFMAFVSGFLMTAIPRMTATESANALEVGLAVGLNLLQIAVSTFSKSANLSVVVLAVQVVGLLGFIGSRAIRMRRVPFVGMIFIPFAFLQVILGIIIFFSGPVVGRQSLILLAGDAFVTNLILGVGSRLIPMISRLEGAVHPSEMALEQNWFIGISAALLLNLSYWLQLAEQTSLGLFLRFAIVCWLAVTSFGLFRRPTVWSVMSVGLKVGVILFIMSLFGQFLNWPHPLAAAHLQYIGGFAMITLFVSTRVVLAHGGGDLRYEVDSKAFMGVMAFLVLAALSRLGAMGNVMSPLMTLSSTLFLVGLMLWIYRYLRTMLRHN